MVAVTITQITPSELETLIENSLRKILLQEKTVSTTPPPAVPQFRTRKETAAILKVTLATLNEYTKSGKIVGNKIGSRVLYKDSDIQQALTKI